MGRERSDVVSIDPAKTYDLPELIDIAERSHPETRVAWEEARAGARAVGLSESAYYPYLAALASADFDHQLVALATIFPGNVAAENAGAELNWLLFDFGGRKAEVAEAREKLMIANVNFNATHQQIVFELTKSFYDFNTARQQVEAAESSLQAAQTVDEAAKARFDNGLATKPDVLQAEQQTARRIMISKPPAAPSVTRKWHWWTNWAFSPRRPFRSLKSLKNQSTKTWENRWMI